jgi:hypothetical protein
MLMTERVVGEQHEVVDDYQVPDVEHVELDVVGGVEGTSRTAQSNRPSHPLRGSRSALDDPGRAGGLLDG